MKRLNALAVFPHLHIQNANMISGPLSWGFPAMTAFLGAVHRLFRESDFPFEAAGVGVVCHGFWPQASRAPGSVASDDRQAAKRYKVSHAPDNAAYALHLNRFPVDKKGSAASVIEEGRAHLEITLVLGIAGELETEAEGPKWAEEMGERLQGISIAGGSVLPCGRQPAWHPLPDALSEQSEAFRNIRYRLLPGFTLLERRDLLLEHLDEMRKVRPEAGEVDALLDLCRINWEVEPDPDNPDRGIWTVRRREGWLAPIPVGFRALSPLYDPGSVRNARDRETPFRFVESLYTLGEWKSPHRLSSPRELLWQYHDDENAGLYLCTQQGDFI